MTEKQLKQHYYDRAILSAKIYLLIATKDIQNIPKMEAFETYCRYYWCRHEELQVLCGEGVPENVKGLPAGNYTSEL